MLKDIQVDNNINVGIAIVKELNNDLEIEWNVYTINFSEDKVTNVFVTCKGYGEINGEPKESSVMRYFLDDLEPQMAIKVEPINPDLFALNNEYFITFFQGGDIHDKKLTFGAHTISEDTLTHIDVVDRLGVYLK